MSTLAFVLLAVALLAGGAWAALAYGGRGQLADPGSRGVAAYAAAAVAVLALGGMVVAIALDHGEQQTSSGDERTLALSAAERRGAELFRSTCGSCHSLAAAGTEGEVGPNLDLVSPPVGKTLATIATGMVGYTATMPPNLLQGRDATDVARYVARVARRAGDVPGGATAGTAGRPSDRQAVQRAIRRTDGDGASRGTGRNSGGSQGGATSANGGRG
ncbi:MAG TPA: cytochrome c [Conexibacter sp.]|nr:cytochrome c [Conexibacter sp.]